MDNSKSFITTAELASLMVPGRIVDLVSGIRYLIINDQVAWNLTTEGWEPPSRLISNVEGISAIYETMPINDQWSMSQKYMKPLWSKPSKEDLFRRIMEISFETGRPELVHLVKSLCGEVGLG